MNLDAEYIEWTYNMASRLGGLPSRYGSQIKEWECNHCGFRLQPVRSMGNFGRVSHGRAEMRKHIRTKHADVIAAKQREEKP